MKYIPHRGGFNESMLELVDLEPTIQALEAHLGANRDELMAIEPGSVKVRLYVNRPDTRIGWDRTFLVTAVTAWDGKRYPCGYTDMMPKVAQ